MAFVKKENSHKIGDWVITQKNHENMFGTMENGTKVQVMDITNKGYSIQDEDGNLITECGWVL